MTITINSKKQVKSNKKIIYLEKMNIKILFFKITSLRSQIVVRFHPMILIAFI